MIKLEHDCENCVTPGYPCLGNLCTQTKIPHYYCDCCEKEKIIYYYKDKQICLECIKKKLKKVEYD